MASRQTLRKLPPEVVRELKRHIAPPGASVKQQQQQQGRSNMGAILFGCLSFTGIAASIPIFAHYWIGNLNERDQPLTAAQVRRGAFMNSGTKDVGRDPQWDFRRGQYKKDENYYSFFERNESTPSDSGGKSDKLESVYYASGSKGTGTSEADRFAENEKLKQRYHGGRKE